MLVSYRLGPIRPTKPALSKRDEFVSYAGQPASKMDDEAARRFSFIEDFSMENKPSQLLIVGGDQADRDTLVSVLQEHGHRVDSSGERASRLQAALAQQPFDLMLLGTTLPDMTSRELAAHVRVTQNLSGMPILLLVQPAEAAATGGVPAGRR